MMDDIDRKLLARLQVDATTSMAELADHVRLSATPVWKRIQRMEQSGVIQRRVVLLDPKLVGIGLIVFVAIEAHEHTPDWLSAFAGALAAMPEVMDAYRMAGEVDYMLRVAVPDMGAFDAFYKRLIAAIPLKNVTSRFAMERLKQTTAYPLPDHAFRDRRGSDPVLDALAGGSQLPASRGHNRRPGLPQEAAERDRALPVPGCEIA